MNRFAKFLLGSFLLACLSSALPSHGEIRFQTVALNGQHAPGTTHGIIFSSFDREIAAGINRQGLIAFGAHSKDVASP